jgi:hypothetical protein
LKGARFRGARYQSEVLEKVKRELEPAEDQRREESKLIDREYKWPSGTVTKIEESAVRGWAGESADWFADDEPFLD